MTRRLLLFVACLAVLVGPGSAGPTFASALFDGTNADLWLVDPETGRISGVNVDVGGWLSDFNPPGGAVYPLDPGVSGVVNHLPGSSVPMTPGQPIVSMVGLGDPDGDGGAPGQMRLAVTPASGTYDETISVKLGVSTSLLDVNGYELRWTVTGGPGPVSRVLGPDQLGHPGAEVQGGYLVAHTIHLVRDGVTTVNVTLEDPSDVVIGTLSRSYTIASTHPDGFRRDTDGDGVPDLVEAEIGLDPLSEDWGKDSDGDGWSDFDEWLRRWCLDGSNVPDTGPGLACLDGDGNPLDTDADGWADFDEKLRRTRFDDPVATVVPGAGETAESQSYLERVRALKDFPAARRLYEVERVVPPGQSLPDAGPAAVLVTDQENDQPIGSSYRDGAVQSFVPTADNLTGVDVMLGGGDAAFDDLTLLVWTDPIRESPPLVRARLREVSTAEGLIASFRFPAVELAPGAVHYIEILAEEAWVSSGTLPGTYADGAVVEASGLKEGALLFGGQVDLWFRTHSDTAWDGRTGGRPAGTEWSRVVGASPAGEVFHAPEQLLDPGEISGAGLTFADVADRKEAAVHAAALDVGEWPAMRLPAGDGAVVAAGLAVAADTDAASESIYKGWLGAVSDANPKQWFTDVGVGTWTTPSEWRVAFVAHLDASLAVDELLGFSEDDAVAVSLLEAALAEEARLRGGAASVLFAHAVDRELVEGAEEDLQGFGGDALRLGDVLAALEAAGQGAEPIADLSDLARMSLRSPEPGTRSDAASSALLQQSYDAGCYITADTLEDMQAFHRELSAFGAECPDWVDEAERAARDAADAERRHRLRTFLLPGAAPEVLADTTLLDAFIDSDADGLTNGLEIDRPLTELTLPWDGDTDGDSLADGGDPCPRDAFDECSGAPRLPGALAGADVLVSEPEAGSGIAIISVKLERTYDEPVTLSYEAITEQGDTAQAGVDFDATPGQVTIRPGERVVLITVRIYQDGQTEPQEFFHLRLTDADNAVLGGDALVQVAIDDTEGTVTGPTAVLLASDVSVDERANVLLVATGSTDPLGQGLSFSWRQIDNGAPLVTLGTTDAATLAFDAPAVLMNTSLEFEVRVTDGGGLSDTAIAMVGVLAINDPPVITGSPRYQVATDSSLVLTDAQLLAFATDPEGDTLTVGAIVTQPNLGSLADTGNGFVYTPAPPAPALEIDVDNQRAPNGGYATPLIQSFTPHQDNLAGVDVCLYPGGVDRTSDITLKVWNNPARIGVPLYEESRLGFDALTQCSVVEFRFDPIGWPADVPLYLELIASDLLMGVSIDASNGSPGFYLEGAIVERAGGSLPQSGADLLFRTYYDPGFGSTGGVDVALLSQPEITGYDWIVNGTKDTVLLHEFGAALDAPGTVRTMAVDLATKERTLVLETEPYDYRATEGHSAVWFRTHEGAMVHRYDPTATPKLVSIATPALLLPDIVTSLQGTAVDPRTGDLHYCERDSDVENDKHWYRLSHADGSLTSTGDVCPRFDDIEDSIKIGRRSCVYMSSGGFFCTDIDGVELKGAYELAGAFSEGPPPGGDVRLLGVQKVGDAALVFAQSLEQFSIPHAVQVRLLTEEFPPEDEPPGPGDEGEPSDLDVYFPLLLELTEIAIPHEPAVTVLPGGGVIVAFGEEAGFETGTDQALLYHWSGDTADHMMSHLNAGRTLPTTFGRAGELATIGDRVFWQTQGVLEDANLRNISEVEQTPGTTPSFSVFASLDGIEGDDAPLDLLDLGGGFFAVLQDPVPVGTNSCNLMVYDTSAQGQLIETFFHCRGHQSLSGRGSLFEVMEGQRNLMFLGIDGPVGSAETTFSVEIEDPGGEKAILPVTVEVVAP